MLLLLVCSPTRQRTPFPPMMLMLFSVDTNIHKHGILSLALLLVSSQRLDGGTSVCCRYDSGNMYLTALTIHTTTTKPWMAKCTKQISPFPKSPVCLSVLAKILYARRITQGFIVKDGRKGRGISLVVSFTITFPFFSFMIFTQVTRFKRRFVS